jgi:hypothetical protein
MQTKRESEKQQITVYWWNFGKTLDFKGSYKDYLQQRNIKVRHTSTRDANYLRFKISVGSSRVILDVYGEDYASSFNEAIKIFLTLMGDKAKLITPHREFNINW